MKKKLLFILMCLLFCLGISKHVFAQQDSQAARQLADKAAALIQEAKAADLHALLLPEMASAINTDDVQNIFSQYHLQYGKLIRQEFKAVDSGKRYQMFHTIEILKHWYKTTTEKYPEGVYTTVETAFEGNKEVVTAFAVVMFTDGKIPPHLK